MSFDGLPKGHYGAILADPPWAFETFSGPKIPTTGLQHYQTMSISEICALPVISLAKADCSLFLWYCWPTMPRALEVIEAWGFTYKTCAFCWIKANGSQIDLFNDEIRTGSYMGYWTKSNSEACLLATRGHPKRLNADVRQAIIAPRREHSRKPEGVHASIQRLVAGPYLELFARQQRPGWDVWGNQTDRFAEAAE